MNEKPFAEYAERNSRPILEVLRTEFAELAHRSSVLEIGSGTGQHAARFAAQFPHLTWQTSDLAENHPGIEAWVQDAALPNLRSPLLLDVLSANAAAIRPGKPYDAVYSANTVHIMSIDAVEKMFALIATVLTHAGVFCLYGPFRIGNDFNTVSNANFHRTLRSRDSAMGIRHLESLDRFGRDHELTRVRLYAMPANNHIAVWQKTGHDVA